VRWSAAALLALWGAGAQALEQPTYLGPKPPASPRRVVTLAPSLTDCVLAMGAGNRLVGVSRYDEVPEVAQLPRVGGFVDPSVEAVLALNPDLVVVQPGPGNEKPVQKLAELKVPVLALPMHTLAQVERALEELGRAMGLPKQGQELARALEAARARARDKARSLPHPRVLFVYGFEPLQVAGPGSFADEMMKDVGAVNVAADAASPYPEYTPEAALAARPDVIVEAAPMQVGRDALAGLEGLRRARWVKLSSQSLLHPGPRLTQGLDELFALVHGWPDAGR
jgi:iron complex transport system substrate-binding protein